MVVVLKGVSIEAKACVNDVCVEHASPTSTLLTDIAQELGSDGSTSYIGAVDKIVLAYNDGSSVTEYSDLSWSISSGDWTEGVGITCTDTNGDGYADMCKCGSNYVCKTATASGSKTVNLLRAYSGSKLYFEISFNNTTVNDGQDVRVCFYISAKITVDESVTTISPLSMEDHAYVLLLRKKLTTDNSVKVIVATAKFWDNTQTQISGSLSISRHVSGTTATIHLYFTPDGDPSETVAVYKVNVYPDTTNTGVSDGLGFVTWDMNSNSSSLVLRKGVTNQVDIVFNVGE